MKMWIFLALSCFCIACSYNHSKENTNESIQSNSKVDFKKDTARRFFSTVASIPVLCYHQLRDYRPGDSKLSRDYIVPPVIFEAQMKALSDSGYHSVSPDELYNHLTKHSSLPTNPIMITFDDTDLDQYTVGAPILKKFHFKGVFFIMTVSIGRPHYMSKAQIRNLSDAGHTIGSHTWDHHNVKKYNDQDWVIQVDQPTKVLQEITGKKIDYFAYPFGLWNEESIPHLKERGFKAAFQLYGKNSQLDSLFTIKRVIITGDMAATGLFKRIHQAF